VLSRVKQNSDVRSEDQSATMSVDPLLDTATSALLLSPVVIDQLIDPL